ncbi:TetR/AcrR family transcriptional regulator [Bradyrhizobium sp. USDA 4353]
MMQAPAARDAALLATLKLIGRHGLAGVTHRAVALEAGLSLGAVTYHYRSRDELIEAALQSAIERERGRQHALSRKLAGNTFSRTKWIEQLARWYADEAASNPEVHLACYEAFLAAARAERYRASIADLQETWNKTAQIALVAACVPRAADRAPVFVDVLTGMLLRELALPRRGASSRFRKTLGELLHGWSLA